MTLFFVCEVTESKPSCWDADVQTSLLAQLRRNRILFVLCWSSTRTLKNSDTLIADLLSHIQQEDFLLSVIIVLGIGLVESDSYHEEGDMGCVRVLLILHAGWEVVQCLFSRKLGPFWVKCDCSVCLYILFTTSSFNQTELDFQELPDFIV